MSRYRPPRPKSSPYITRAGYDALQSELTYLWKTKRPEVTAKVSEAAAQGDRSENAEYIYGKKQLREIDGRIQFLSKRLDVLEVIDRLPSAQDKVFFGAWVTVEDEAGQTRTIRIVGADEIDPKRNWISIDSPMARALVGRHLDDNVSVAPQRDENAPHVLQFDQPVDAHYVIVDITYGIEEKRDGDNDSEVATGNGKSAV